MPAEHSIWGHIFVSYCRAESDTGFALALANDLRLVGHQVWLDTTAPESTAGWSDEIKAAMDACYACVIVLSPAALESTALRNELAYARKVRPGLIYPVQIEAMAIPAEISAVPAIDFAGDYRAALARLLEVLPKPPWDPAVTAPSIKRPEWSTPVPTGTHARYAPKRPPSLLARWWRPILALTALIILLLTYLPPLLRLPGPAIDMNAALIVPPALLGAVAVGTLAARRRIAGVVLALMALGSLAIPFLFVTDLSAALYVLLGALALFAALLPAAVIWLFVQAARGRA